MNKRVLVIDDDEGARLTLSALLEDEGYAVEQAASCREGEAALAPTLDVVIVDYHLGDGLGSDLMPAIRARAPRACVIVSSGSADGISFGDAVFTKGGSFDELFDLLRRLTGSVVPVRPTGGNKPG